MLFVVLEVEFAGGFAKANDLMDVMVSKQQLEMNMIS